MSLRPAHALPALLLEHANLRPARFTFDDGQDVGIGDKRCAGEDVAAVFFDEQHLAQRELGPRFARGPFKIDEPARRDSHLSARGLDDGVHFRPLCKREILLSKSFSCKGLAESAQYITAGATSNGVDLVALLCSIRVGSWVEAAEGRVNMIRTPAIAAISAILSCGGLIACSSPTTPGAAIDLTGTWAGTASDAGPVRWTITQTAGRITGTSMLIEASTGGVVVTGSIDGTLDASQALTFEQVIGLFQFPATGPWSQYWPVGFDTTGTVTLRGGNQLVGRYIGSVNMLRSPPGPLGQGGPFTNGTLTLTRQ